MKTVTLTHKFLPCKPVIMPVSVFEALSAETLDNYEVKFDQ